VKVADTLDQGEGRGDQSGGDRLVRTPIIAGGTTSRTSSFLERALILESPAAFLEFVETLFERKEAPVRHSVHQQARCKTVHASPAEITPPLTPHSSASSSGRKGALWTASNLSVNFTAKCFGAVAADVSLYSNLTSTGLGVVVQKA